MDQQFSTPILFLLYNRPETTGRVFEVIAQIAPKQLFVAADGPNPDKPGDGTRCQQARAVVRDIAWDCELKTRFQDRNLGCKEAVSSAITWFFEHVQEGIILEDDCLPHLDFFRFCAELLAYYREEGRVSSITGHKPFKDTIPVSDSYFFSKYNPIWGWATWRRAWSYYDVTLSHWPGLKKSKGHHLFFYSDRERRFFERTWDKCHANQLDTWDYQWALAKLIQISCTVIPAVNLVSNIGFGGDATHTTTEGQTTETHGLEFPLVHPKQVSLNFAKDVLFSKTKKITPVGRLKNWLVR